MHTKRNIFLWTMYDFSNSLVSIVFFMYFAQWVVIDRGLPDLWFNLTFTFSTILLLLAAPFFGILLDRHLRHITGIRYTTVLTVILFGICSIFVIANNNIGALVLYTLGLFTYQLSFTFYTPLINNITTSEKRGRVSGYGIAANYLGQFTGLLFVLPFSNGSWSLFHASPRAETLIPSVIAFIIFSLPILLFFKQPFEKKVVSEFKSHTKELVVKTKALFAYPGVGLYILAYFFFNDAILTASNNFSIFLEQVWGVSDTTKTFILLGIVLTSAIGGLVSGFVADRFGHKKTMIFILSGWLVILPLIGFLNNFILFVIATTLMGFWFGANWAVSRSVMAYLSPKSENNLAFSYFNLIERTSSLVGPVVWGLVVSNFLYMGSYRYRLATLVITLCIILGLWALSKVKSDRP